VTLRLWPGNPVPSGTSAGAEDALTLGTQFSVSAACSLVGIWWYSPPGAQVLPQACGIWDVSSQALVCEDAAPLWLDPGGSVASPGDGWVRCGFAGAGVTLASGLDYAASVWQGDPGVPWWVTVSGYWTTGAGSGGIGDGALSAPNAGSSANGQGCWDTGGAWQFPEASPGNGEAFYVDVEVSEIVPAVTFTVTATATLAHDDVVLLPYVITNGAEGGGEPVVSGGYGAPEFTLTPAAGGSVVVAGVYDAGGGGQLSPAAGNATDDDGLTSGNGNSWWYGHYAGTVTEGDAVTLGGTNDDGWNAWGAYEVIPSGGSPAIDPSTPAAVHALNPPDESATTAPFTPPAGSVLVAIILSDGTGAQGFAVSDTSGLGLTWTQRGAYSVGYVGSSAVFTTTIPAPGGRPAPAPSAVPAFLTTIP
jgi:hypothetical protein